MAISFQDSLKNIENNVEQTIKNANYIEDNAQPIMPLAENYDIVPRADSGNWISHSGYVTYSVFEDNDISTVTSEKDIRLSSKQFNITQEENSQYIPFEMPRRYDGFDLVNSIISIHYETDSGRHGATKPINVKYNSEKIRFAWLVDAGATIDVGKLKFEIHAYGTIRGSDGESKGYVWKSKKNENLNVLESLCDCEDVVNNIDDTWIQELVTDIAKEIADEIKNVSVGAQVEAAENAAIAAAQSADQAKQYAENASTVATDTVNAALSRYVSKDEAANHVTTEQLTEGYYNKTDTAQLVTSSLENYATKDDVSDAISSADLDSYYKKTETYSAAEIDEKLGSVSVDLTGYATETYVDNKTSILLGDVNTNKDNISSLSETVKEMQEIVNSVDTSARLSYEATYGSVEMEDGSTSEHMFTLWETEGENEPTVKSRFQISGGGGGTSTGGSLEIKYVDGYKPPIVVTLEDRAIIKYIFAGKDSSGDDIPEGTATWKVDGRIVATHTAINGENEFDITEYLAVKTQKVNLSITDEAGNLATKSWTVQRIEVKLESGFNDKLTYPIGKVVFDYTPYGSVSKDIHFKIDGVEIGKITTASSGVPMSYELPAQTHGSHLLEVYMTATVTGKDIESNHILKDIIWRDDASKVPVIGTTYQNFTARQYDTTNIEYTVYDPNTETPTVTIAVDGNVVSTPILNTSTAVYPYKSIDAGIHTITITCGETVKTLTANIEELDIDVTPVTAGLVFDFNPVGKSNNDADKVWKTETVAMTVSENFDWINGGYQIDENGDQYFAIKAGTWATIDYQLFADDAKRNGKEMKLVFKTTNVARPNARFLHCVDNTTGDNHIGIEMFSQEAYIYGQVNNNLHLPYSEEDIIEFEFNISKDTESVPMVMGYEDGVSTRPMVYDESYNFTQSNPKIISLGSEDCDLHVYRFKVYNTSLTAKGILSNFIADARNAEEMVNRYDRNQIYNENNQLDPDILAEKCPWLRVYKLSAPYFTNNKSDKVPNTTIQQIYKGGDPVLDNWTCYDCSHSGQGTSSNNYGAAGRNLDFIMNKSQIEGVKPYFILGDGSRAKKITLTRDSVPVAYLNAKVNIASSNNLTNAMLAGRYNEFNPYNRPFVRDVYDTYLGDEITDVTEQIQKKESEIEKLNPETDATVIEQLRRDISLLENSLSVLEAQAPTVVAEEISKIKDTMQFFNCVIFIQETNEDLSTHREFADNDWHFYAIGNIGDSKKSDSSRLTDMDDKYECCIEVMDVGRALSDFPVDTMMNAMGYKEDETTKEKIYTWAKDENLGILYELIDGEYVLTKDTTVDLNKTYYVDILLHDDFSENYTYGWRYVYEDGTDEENAEAAEYCHQKWIDFYRFVTTSTDEEFRAHLGDYFVVDSALYYFLFVNRYCMVDNLAKNSFYHYGKTGEVDSDGNPIRKFDLAWAYDMDTSLGLNNYGKQVYRYGLETTDVDEGGQEVFRESDSRFFCRIRDLFPNELKAMYDTLESKNAWHAESFINKGDEWQSQFPEELWRLDIERKYIRTYNSSFINGKADDTFLTTMANGKMKYHRRQWERNQEKYMASKYQSSNAGSDEESVIIRCASIPDDSRDDMVVSPYYALTLTPYAYMYLNVQYGDNTTPVSMRAEPNVTYEVPFTGSSLDGIKVYSSSMLQSIGDISACYATVVRVQNANKLKELIVGNSTEGYDNPYLSTLTLGSNYLLEKLNIENVSGYAGSLNLTALKNLEELYAHGSNIGGITFADGGLIEIAELPAINSMTMKNLIYLTNLDVTSFDKLTTLTVENCNTIDLVNVLESAPNVNRVRIVGINWNLEDTTLLDRLYKMSGIDRNGYNQDQSVLTGTVHVPVIKQQQLYDYQKAWPDLEVKFDTMIEQFAVTFRNVDTEGNVTILEVQYVDKGSNAVDPTTRADNPITPTIESTVSHDFTFSHWDASLDAIFAERTITAVYTDSLRSYTIKYVSKGLTMQESTGLYGENVPYTGITPVYTAEEAGYVYYLFNRWDKSGFIDGDKTVNAIFDRFEYTATSFDGRELKDLTPVEIYGMNKMNLAESFLVTEDNETGTGDPYTIVVGNDVDYDDIESELLISEKTYFDGAKGSYQDTGIQLFDVDKDFVLAIDYEFLSGNANNAVLVQCFQANGSNGFKLLYNNSNANIAWGTTSESVVGVNKREIIVIRHKKGDNNLTVYKSNLDGEEVLMTTLTKSKTTSGTGTLVFGCAKADDGLYENYAIGNINWAKIWYKDLGDSVCKDLAAWTHESITLQACGFRKYYLTENQSKRCSFSLLASHLLGRTKRWNPQANGVSGTGNAGGWAVSELRESLNTRLYNAMPNQIRALLKQVIVASSAGLQSHELVYSNDYITIPSIIEVDSTVNDEPFNSEGTPISYLTNDPSRKRAFDGGDYYRYWTRSPSTGWPNYIYSVDENGKSQGISQANVNYGVLIEISF